MGLQIKQKNSNNRIVFLRIQTKDKENLQEKIQRKDTLCTVIMEFREILAVLFHVKSSS